MSTGLLNACLKSAQRQPFFEQAIYTLMMLRSRTNTIAPGWFTARHSAPKRLRSLPRRSLPLTYSGSFDLEVDVAVIGSGKAAAACLGGW